MTSYANLCVVGLTHYNNIKLIPRGVVSTPTKCFILILLMD